jgi:hypothetical protein
MTTSYKAGAAGQGEALPDHTDMARVTGFYATTGETPGYRLNARASQLVALTSLLCGDGLEVFQRCTDETQGQLLSLVHELAREVEHLAEVVPLDRGPA